MPIRTVIRNNSPCELTVVLGDETIIIPANSFKYIAFRVCKKGTEIGNNDVFKFIGSVTMQVLNMNGEVFILKSAYFS